MTHNPAKKIHVHEERQPQDGQLPSAPVVPPALLQSYNLHSREVAAVGHAAVSPAVTPPASLLDNPQTDQAVAAVRASEADALLETVPAAQSAGSVRKVGFWRSIGQFFVLWWQIRWLRYTTLLLMVLALAAVAAIPQTRYGLLNAAGVRSEASVIALDSTTRLPLKNVVVRLDGAQVRTNKQGVAHFSNLRLGSYTLTVKRVAFAPQTRAVTIGWGSNPLGEFKLLATGIQYVLEAHDYLSGRPVAGVEATSDDVAAISDAKGIITLTVEDTQQTTLPVLLTAAGYRSETVTLDAEAPVPKVGLVSAFRHVYVSKQSGRYDVYAADLDGKNGKVLLAGTGLETSNISVSPNAAGDKVAIVSTRDNVRDLDGFLLTTLTLLDMQTGATTTVERGAQVQLLAWMGERLVYRVANPGASAANPQRYRIMAYNYRTAGKLQLTSANQFTASLVAGGYLYYAASSNDPKAIMGLFRIKPDGSSKERVFDKEVWTAIRSSEGVLTVQAPDSWYSYQLSTKTVATAGVPAQLGSLVFGSDATDTQSVWIEERNGKQVLLAKDHDSGKQIVLSQMDGIALPAYWAGKAIIFRVATGGETADYAVSTTGGAARKLGDVIYTYGLGTP